MNRPKIKREIAIIHGQGSRRFLVVTATRDAIRDMKAFTTSTHTNSNDEDCYTLWIDPRYDFDEVVRYIEEYGNE